MTINLWAIAMAKDEGDIIEHTMCHLAANGIDGLIVANNLSKDNTLDKMEAAKEKINKAHPNIEVILLEDNVLAYTQSQKMTTLGEMARKNGAQWIIPFDIDEIWYSPNSSLKQAFIDLDNQNYDVYRTLYTNHSITEFDPIGESPFHSMVWKWNLPTNHKSAFRFRPSDRFVSISNGNHLVNYNGAGFNAGAKVAIDDYGDDKIVFGPQTVQIRHFQWRSLDHFMRKILNAYESCRALGPGADLYNGAAWAEHFKIYEAYGTKGLEDYFHKNILVTGNTGSLLNDPAPIAGLPNV
jgi:hypothetical protein